MKFWKYQGAGNDFILLDQRRQINITRTDQQQVARLCDRRFGIGGDGLILLQDQAGYDFEMVYFNADGRESSMCGNGGRCIAAFARDLGLVEDHCRFLAIDGPHEARISLPEDAAEYWVELKMIDVPDLEQQDPDTFVLNTGSPHYVHFVDALDGLDVVREGRAVRYSERFQDRGINVNLVQPTGNGLRIRTYERGVEDETLACGTGVTAAALAFARRNHNTDGQGETRIEARGGQLSVRFQVDGTGFREVWLCGPARQVFTGNMDIVGFEKPA